MLFSKIPHHKDRNAVIAVKKKKNVTKSEMLIFAVLKLGRPGSITESGMAAYSSVQVIISPAAP